MKKTTLFLALVASMSISAENLILNPGFESGTSFWSDWGAFTLTTTPAEVASGTSAAFVTPELAGGFGQDIAITPGKTYTFKVKAMATGLPALAQTGLELFEGANKMNAPSYVTFENKDSVYAEYVFTVPTLLTTTKCQVWVWKNAGGAIYVDDYVFEVDPTGLSSNQENPKFAVYPVPANDYLILDFRSSFGNNPVSITLSDLTGKTIYSSIASPMSNYKISTSDFTKGLYILSVNANGKTSNQKVMIQ